MKAAIITCLALSVGNGWCQWPYDHTVFEHKSPSAGVPFAWPLTWADASSSGIARADVLRFLADLHRDDMPQMLTAIQSFRFVPLEKDKFYLVADVDASGNGFFGTLEIVRCEGATCVVGIALTEAEDLDTDLVDVSGDGVFQVITKEAVGVRTRSTYGSPPFVYSIRSLVGGDLVDASMKYSEYFKDHILPRIEADRKAVEAEIARIDRPQPLNLSDLDAGKHRTPAEEESERRAATANERFMLMSSAELQYVQDDYRRRILGEKTAGEDNALKWSRSEHESLREFGVDALEPIDSPAAAAELLRIANSQDSPLAERARNALNRRAQAHLALPPIVK
jgi:hypothetical protein